MVWYIDTSALLKLVVLEEETPAMRAWTAMNGPCWSSQLLRTEALRAAGRLGINDQVVVEALETVTLVLPGVPTFLAAGKLEPSTLRSLDALHLAAALELGKDLEGVVTYDARMIHGALTKSISTVTPT